jgi:hypothetical protein
MCCNKYINSKESEAAATGGYHRTVIKSVAATSIVVCHGAATKRKGTECENYYKSAAATEIRWTLKVLQQI